MKLLQKLLLSIVALILLASLAIGFFSYSKSSTSTNDLMMSKVEDQLTLRTELIEEKINSTKRLIALLATDQQVIDDLRRDRTSSDVQERFSNLANENKDLISLISITNDEDVVIGVDDDNLNVLGADLGQRAYLIDAKRSKQPVISDLIISQASGAQVTAIAIPVYYNSTYLGAVIATIDFSLITDVVEATQIAEEGYAYLIDITGDNAGTIVSHKNADYVKNESKLYDFNVEALSNITDDMMVQESGKGYYTYKGDDKYVQYKKIANWSLAITANDSDLKATSTAILKVTILIIVISIITSTVISYFLVQAMITNPIHKLEEVMVRAGDGELNVEFYHDKADEIGNLSKSFMKMINRIHDMVLEINTAADQVNAGAHQVSEASLSLAQGSTEQASSIEELSASIQLISQQGSQSAQTSQEAQEIVETSKAHALEGNNEMTAMLEAMEKINASSSNISNIIKVIDDIAFQTNLLALNAAVEAARAGEHGKGFAVVAEEVRNLAARSADAAKETTELIEDSIINVNKGTSIAKGTAVALKEIVDNIQETSHLMASIADASKDQANNISQINEGIDQISTVVQSTSATAEESAAASEELSGQANILKAQINTFKLR